jgi:hypothetical protein
MINSLPQIFHGLSIWTDAAKFTDILSAVSSVVKDCLTTAMEQHILSKPSTLMTETLNK